MDINERNVLLDRIGKIESYNISELIAKYYNNQDDLNAISVGKYPVKQFIIFFNRAIKQLRLELESENFYFYPIQGNAQPIGGINLTNVINDIMNLLASNKIPSIEASLNLLITYEYYFGIWHISQFKVHSVKAKELKEKTEVIDLQNQKVSELFKKLSNKIDEIDEYNNGLKAFIENKQSELNQITNNLARANQETNDISSLLAQSQKSNQQIESLIQQQNQKFSEIKKLFEIETKAFEEYKKQNVELEERLKQGITQAEDTLKKSEEQLSFISGKKDDIVRLTGMAADGSLGSKFDERQNKLNKSFKFWRWAVPVITLSVIVYIFVIFYFFNPNPEISIWVLLSISLLKTTPALFILFWVFRQYVKERNIQEEYAFKSAVAMTITAYSDLLDNRDSNTNTTRQKMILNAIQEVHRSPRLLDEKDSSKDVNVANNIQETLKQILELVKEVKK